MNTKVNTIKLQWNYSGIAASVLYVGTVWAANYAILHFGYDTPSGIHIIPVWPGIDAPSGVIFAGLTFTLRDMIQDRVGRLASITCIIIGSLLSMFLSSELAAASGIAFLVSELLDLAVYTPIRSKSIVMAIIASNTVGLTIDSILFLSIARIPLSLLPGQIIGKMWMTVIVIAIILVIKRKSRQFSEMN